MISNLFARSAESRANLISGGHPSNFLSFMAGADSFSGISVNESNALTFTAVYSAVRILSEGLAQPPLKLYRKRSDGGRDEADGEPESYLLRHEPNPETTSFIWRELGQGHLCTWGNFYSEIVPNGAGRATALWQRRPDRVTIDRGASGGVIYRIDRAGGGTDVLPAERVLHIPGLSFSGYKGLSPIGQAREAIGLGLATERHGSVYFGNGSRPGGVLETPGKLGEGVSDQLRGQWEEMHRGPNKSNRVAILEHGLTWKQIGLPMDDSQFLETRTFQVREIARIYRVPPHMLADLADATFSNVEQMSLEFLVHTMGPWYERWEAELNRKILGRRMVERGFYFKFDIRAFMRGDVKTRTEAYTAGRNGGWLSPNDIRKLEDLNPREGGDEYLAAPAGAGGAPNASPDDRAAVLPAAVETRVEPITAEQRSLKNRWRLRETFERLLLDSVGRVVTREVNILRKELKRIERDGLESFLIWLREDFTPKNADFARKTAGPVLVSFMESIAAEVRDELGEVDADMDAAFDEFSASYVDAFGTRHSESRTRQIAFILNGDEAMDERVSLVGERLDGWLDHEAEKIANRESAQAGNAMARAMYAASGVVTAIVWRANRGACPLCSEMDGRVVEIERSFLASGDKVSTDDEDTADLEVKQVRNHPPLHRSCSCGVSVA